MVSSYERRLADTGTRKALGAYYTPSDVVSEVLDLCLDPLLADRRGGGPRSISQLRVLDPACGTGNFLVAAAERIAAALHDAGMASSDAGEVAATRCVAGVDIDPEAVERCRAALASVAGPGVSHRRLHDVVRCGDSLLEDVVFGDGSWDLVVGNPPFLSQLGTATARRSTEADGLRARFGAVVGAYTDPAVLFLVRAVDLAKRDGGTVALLEPQSTLSAADARAARQRLMGQARLEALWSLDAQVFDAAVQVCLPVLRRGPSAQAGADVDLFVGRQRRPVGTARSPTTDDATWSALLAALDGVPERELRARSRIGDLASATADFRDQYYGLAPHVAEREDGPDDRWPKLITTGLVDPAQVAWGERDTRFNKARFRHPRVDRASLPSALGAWADRRLQPKVLVATQTRVIEAVVDPTGALLPSVPLVSVSVPGPALWRVAAALSAPALTLEALRRHLGSGRNPKAIRLRAAEVTDLPLPALEGPWDEATRELEAAHACADHGGRRERLEQAGRLMNRAYGLGDDEELLAWWLGRMPAPHR